MDAKKMMENAMQRAAALLNSLPAGEEVVFEGECPSGATYESRTVWDGTQECRDALLKKAHRLGYPDAWQARLVAVEQVKQGMASAEMRTA